MQICKEQDEKARTMIIYDSQTYSLFKTIKS